MKHSVIHGQFWRKRVAALGIGLSSFLGSGHNAGAAVLLSDDFSTDPQQQDWVCSDWNLDVLTNTGWSTNGYLSVDPGFTPFWVSPTFDVAPFDYYRITAVSRGAVGLCGVGYNLGSTWGRYPNTNYQGLLVADDWTVTAYQSDWQTNVYCTRCLVNANKCAIRLSGGDVRLVVVDSVTRGEVRVWADAVYAAMPPLNFTPQPGRFANLSRTHSLLTHRQNLTVVLLGDSIMNDTCHSTFDVLLERKCGYDGSTRVLAIPAVGGGAGIGMWADDTNWNWPQTDLDLQQAVIDQNPDLVIIGGISNGTNYDAFANVISRILSGVSQEFGHVPDILLMTGAFGTGTDPDGYASQLRALAGQWSAGFMDMRSAWSNYMALAASEGIAENRFYRDDTHANQFGKQFLGRVLASELAPDPPQILSVRPAGHLLQITWQSEPGAAYSLWTKQSLDNAVWSLVATNTATTTNDSWNVDISGENSAIYRVSTP